MKTLLDAAYSISILSVFIIGWLEPNSIGLIIAASCAAVISLLLLIISKLNFIKKISVALVLALFAVLIFKTDVALSLLSFSMVTYFLSLIAEFKMRKPFEK